MRERRRKDRPRSMRSFEIDILVPGLGAVTGKGDRFRCSAETRDAKVLQERRRMVQDLGQRLLHDVLAGRLEGKFTTEQLAVAYKRGSDALKQLLQASQQQLLAPLLDRWIMVCTARHKRDYRRQVASFIEFCGGSQRATVGDLNTEKIAKWLGSLTDARRGKSGARVRSQNPEAIADRRRRAKRRSEVPLRPISGGTRNRYRTAMSAFCTFLTNVVGAIAVHPIRAGRLRGQPENPPRMPDIDSDTWKAYCVALSADPLALPEYVLVARVLRHTGADVGEVLGQLSPDGLWIQGMLVRDIKSDRSLPRIRFKRHKVLRSPERLVPYPRRLAKELNGHVERHQLRRIDPVFHMVNRSDFEDAHLRAVEAVGHPELRLKDLRHLAAIAWARAGVRLERISEWLGHSSIRQTMIYARFAPDDAFDLPAAERAVQIAEGTDNSKPQLTLMDSAS